MTAELEGRLAVVAGASRGIGAAIALALGRSGATVVRLARSLDDARAERRIDLRCDLTDDDARARTVATILELGVPALVVSNAGAFELGPFEEQTLDGLDRMYRANLRAPFALAQALLPVMRAGGGGRHVLIGSIADHLAFPGNSAYAATKFGVRGLHEVLRAEYRGSGVLCTLISPGPVDTPLWDPVDPERHPGLLPRSAMLKPGHVAEAVVWVATRPPRVDVDWIRMGPG